MTFETDMKTEKRLIDVRECINLQQEMQLLKKLNSLFIKFRENN